MGETNPHNPTISNVQDASGEFGSCSNPLGDQSAEYKNRTARFCGPRVLKNRERQMPLGSGGADKNAPEQHQKWITPPAPGGMWCACPALTRVAFKAFPPRLKDRLEALTGEPKHRIR
jgi:hypothetical protein